MYLIQSMVGNPVMSLIHSIAAKVDVVLPRNFSALNALSILLLGVAVFLPLVSSLIVLMLSMLIQASFFRVMHREKVGLYKLLKRLGFMAVSFGAIMIILFQHHLL